MNLDLYSQYTQIYSKGIKDLNVRAKSTRLLKKTGINLYDLELGNGFFDMIPKAQATEVKINTWDYIKFKSFCTAKGTIYKRKDNLQMRRKYLQTIYLIRS